MNSIEKITFDFRMQSESFARALYTRWDVFFAGQFESVAREVLSDCDEPRCVMEIPVLELDLGEFTEDDFYTRFPLKLREKLRESLLGYFNGTQGWRERRCRKITEGRALFEALAHFLLHGTFAGDLPDAYKNVRRLFLAVLQQEAKAFCYFLQTYGHYTSLRERLVYQLDDPELEKGVELLEPSNAFFICSYVRFLRERYAVLLQPVLNKRSYRNVVWQIVYAYLLNDRSSYFNKKSFVAQTILRLGTANNLSYGELIDSITQDLKQFVGKMTLPVELFVILSELAAEFLQKEQAEGIRPDVLEEMISWLSKAESCRIFLQHMSETEIRNLVGMVAPQESGFVLDTAHSLQQQQQSGELQGKAGGEFRLLKWQIIFPLLFANRGAGLNRKCFIESLFRQIAAHYNLIWTDLLAYVYENEALYGWADFSFRSVIGELYSGNRQVPDHSEFSESAQSFPQGGSVPVFDTEEAYREFIVQYFPSEAEFAGEYAAKLELFKERGNLLGRAGREFGLLKWRFILEVLCRMPSAVVNRKFFVGQTLQRLAAHYHLSYLDLLIYFQTEEVGFYLSQDLHGILRELFFAVKGKWVETLWKGNAEALNEKALRLFSPKDHVFILHCMQAMHPPPALEKGSGKIPGTFREIKWRIVFEVLLEMKGVAFNKKAFVSRMLSRLAAHYNLSMEELLSFVLQSKQVEHPLFRTFFPIVTDLYAERSVRLRPQGREEKTAGPDAGTAAGRRELFQWIKTMRLYFLRMFGIRMNEQELQQLLKGPDGGDSLPVSEIIRRVSEWAAGFLTGEQRALFDRFICREQALHLAEKEADVVSGIYLSNAGLVLIAPYLPRLFALAGLTGEGAFLSPKNSLRALFLMQYAVTGELPAVGEAGESGVYRETELVLNKLLAGRELSDPVEQEMMLTETEIQLVESMLKGVLANWSKLGSTSVAGFREAFLMRPGKLVDKGAHYELTVAEKSYDLLLDTLPWNFRTIRYSWMEKPIQVKWR